METELDTRIVKIQKLDIAHIAGELRKKGVLLDLPRTSRDTCCELQYRSKEFCVCTRLMDCPIHGETHVGTHD